MSDIGWRFGSLDFGRKEGLNDSSVSFKGSQLFSSLPKEIIQNSIDARKDINTPVFVKFEMQKWGKDDIPDYEELCSIFESCRDFWDDKKIKSFFENALKVANKDFIHVLKVSDFNTFGLVGSDDEREQSPWFSLVKSTGVSNKGEGSGGSYGVGKTAPLVNSDFRVLFYHTVDENGLEAAQGVASLVTHTNPNAGVDPNIDNRTQNVGYYGLRNKSKHLSDGSLINRFLNRKKDEIGTDVYVLAYKEHENWKERMISSVIEIFFISILEEILIVEIDGVLIDKNSIHNLIKKHFVSKKNSILDYYKTFIAKEDNEKKFIIPLSFYVKDEFIDGITLHLLIEDGLNKRVCKMRSNRMVICNKGHDFIKEYSAVLIAHGSKINNYLKEMESPQHDKWDINMNSSDNKFSEELMRQLNKHYKKAIQDRMFIDTSDSIELDSLNKIMSSSLLDLDKKNKKYKRNNVSDFNIKTKTKTDDPSATDVLDDVSNVNNKNKKDRKNIEFKDSFATMTDRKKGEYVINITPLEDKKGFVTVFQVGEDVFEPVEIKNAKNGFFNAPIYDKKVGKIGPINFKKDKKESFKIKLADNLRCALEVRLYED